MVGSGHVSPTIWEITNKRFGEGRISVRFASTKCRRRGQRKLCIWPCLKGHVFYSSWTSQDKTLKRRIFDSESITSYRISGCLSDVAKEIVDSQRFCKFCDFVKAIYLTMFYQVSEDENWVWKKKQTKEFNFVLLSWPKRKEIEKTKKDSWCDITWCVVPLPKPLPRPDRLEQPQSNKIKITQNLGVILDPNLTFDNPVTTSVS